LDILSKANANDNEIENLKVVGTFPANSAEDLPYESHFHLASIPPGVMEYEVSFILSCVL
jgi:hypothetical protein